MVFWPIGTIWGEFFNLERFQTAGKVPKTLMEAKDITYVFGTFLMDSVNDFINQRDDLMSQVDAFIRTSVGGDIYEAWRDYMCSCALATNHLFTKLR